MHCLKPATHLAILYADRCDRRKSPGVPGAAIAIFADRRDRLIKSPISGMSDIMGCQTSQYCIPFIWSVPLFMWSTSLNFKWSTLDFLYAQLDFLYGQPDFNMVNY